MLWYSAAEGDTDAQERIVTAWIDAPTSNLEVLGMLLGVARDQVWAFAPESEDDDSEPVEVPDDDDPDVPARLVMAQLRQAQALWDAGRVDSQGAVGIDEYRYTPRPLDKSIRGIIRPTKGRPEIG